MKTIQPHSPFGEVAYRHARVLSAEIGARPSATTPNQAARAYIESILKKLGYRVEAQEFAAYAWQEGATRLTTAERRFAAYANIFSPSCHVSGELVSACSLDELRASNLTGKLVLLYGDLTKSPISPKSWFLISDWEKELISLLENGRPLGLITIQTRPGELERVFEDWEFTIPSAVVSAQTGCELLSLPPSTRLQLEIEATLEPGVSANLVARQAGACSERIVLMAHYDTKPDTPGALDNASGVGVLLALAERFARVELKYGLELVAFANEELLPIGDDEYLRRGEASFPEIIAALNFDGVGQLVAANSITAIGCSPGFLGQLQYQARDFPGFVWVEPWPQSNHSTFAWRQVPSLAFSSVGHFHTEHLQSDTIDWLSPVKLTEVVELAAGIVTSLQTKATDWTR